MSICASILDELSLEKHAPKSILNQKYQQKLAAQVSLKDNEKKSILILTKFKSILLIFTSEHIRPQSTTCMREDQ